MEFRDARMLRGPNLWAECPMFEVCLGPEHHALRPTSEFAELKARFAEWLPWMPDPMAQGPTAADASAAAGPSGAVMKRAADPLLAALDRLSMAETLLRLTQRLQRIACGRTDLVRGFARSLDEAPWQESLAEHGAVDSPAADSLAGGARIALECEDEALARLCLASAWRMLQMGVNGDDAYDAQDEVRRLHLFADDFSLGPSTRALVAAARRRHIPVRRLNQFSLVQLGGGVHQRRILTAETDRTGAIAEGIARDKHLTKRLLWAVGAPAPHGRIVASREDAWNAACEVGLPVVVKPTNGNHGRGVSLNLNSRQQVETAFQHALREGDGVLVEQFARGAEHRLLVVEGRVVAATRGEPDQVEGDGARSIVELVAALNEDPRRGRHYAFAFSHVELDAAALLTLEQQGYHPDSIPPAGEWVVIHRNGEYTTDETDEVHPEVAAMAVLAAQTVGLNIAGIDLIARDIGRPLEEQQGMIVEVNAGPGLLMHLEPQRGKPRPVAEMIVESMFPPGKPGRLPTVTIAGAADADARLGPLVARMLKAAGHFVGHATPREARIDDRTVPGRGDLGRRIEDLSTHPWLTAMVVETDLATLHREGMPCEHCEVALIGAEFGAADDERDVFGPDAARSAVASTVLPQGWAALWVDDPRAQATAAALGRRVIWLAEDSHDPRLKALLAAGARAVVWQRNSVVFVEGNGRWPLGVEGRRLDGLRDASVGGSGTAGKNGVALHGVYQNGTPHGGNGSANGFGRLDDHCGGQATNGKVAGRSSGDFDGLAERVGRRTILAAAAAGWGLGMTREAICLSLAAFEAETEGADASAVSSR